MSTRPLIRTTRAFDQETARMAEEVRASLTAPRPWLPSKYLYDDHGSRLFEAITRLPEYYQTRTEEAILESIADGVIGRVRPRELVEIGSGAGRKIQLLLEAMQRARLLERCLLFDINHLFVRESVQRLAARFRGAKVRGVVGDFHHDLASLGAGGERLVIFLGGTIGNLTPDEVPAFLRALTRQLAPGDAFLLGVDLVKDAQRLHDAYNDSAGVTAAFTLNLLRTLNERLAADFDVSGFEHVATWEPENAWIRIRLRATQEMTVRIAEADLELSYSPGDEIQTEISCKYTRASLEGLVDGTGLAIDRWYSDAEDLFALALLRPA